ncbi:hypothetical protein [Pedobacter sp. ISL-64]|uniref:hypothetical protein n=1 Tax=Pedobacter sp. ISL-64 TaxID=2819164 RepID=UPI00293D2D3C|nr:hypothetical protein [Pedobacter sp. ISL-64]
MANVTESDVDENYKRVKREVADLVRSELKKIADFNKESVPEEDRPAEVGKTRGGRKVKENRPAVKGKGRNVKDKPIKSVSM